jgi:hypothetical protein
MQIVMDIMWVICVVDLIRIAMVIRCLKAIGSIILTGIRLFEL